MFIDKPITVSETDAVDFMKELKANGVKITGGSSLRHDQSVKAMSEEFYRSMCHASLQPVLENCIYFKRELGKHLEITNLVIPGKNDSPEQIKALLDWVEQELGLDQVIHFSAYFPAYKYHESPRTPAQLIRKICAEAFHRGFSRIYAGNI